MTTTGVNLTNTFAYDAGGSGELTTMTTPYGGQFIWQYTSRALQNRSLREIEYRYLRKAVGGALTSVQLTRDPGDTARTETGIERIQAPQTVRQKTGRREKPHAQRHLSDAQKLLQTGQPATGRPA